MKITTITLNPALDIHSSVDFLVPEIKLRCDRPTYIQEVEELMFPECYKE
jgi:fructose-1-phosphate kinase PfkB-like protein